MALTYEENEKIKRKINIIAGILSILSAVIIFITILYGKIILVRDLWIAAFCAAVITFAIVYFVTLYTLFYRWDAYDTAHD